MDIEQIRNADRGTSVDTKQAALGFGKGLMKLGLLLAGLAAIVALTVVLFSLIVADDGLSQRRVEARMAVQAQLKDPDSAQFRNLAASEDVVCGEVNAKNAFGGYVGHTRFIYVGTSVMMEQPDDGGFFAKMWGSTCSKLK